MRVIYLRLYFRNPLFSGEIHLAVVILARGGSKGIPLKNLAKIGRKSLLEITLNELKNVEGINSIWVSTDHPGIAEVADKGIFHSFVFFYRVLKKL